LELAKHHTKLPREILIGNEAIESVGKICHRLGFGKSALIITGPKTCVVAGKTVKIFLEEEGLATKTVIVQSSTLKDIRIVEKEIEAERPQVVFGVGGGTKIDVAKLGSAHKNIPFISIPTTASHDGIASPLASIKELKKPYSVMAQVPIAVIADTYIIGKAPKRFITSGCGDVISKFTAVRDWKLANKEMNEYYGDYAASLALMSAKLIIQNAKLIKNRKDEGIKVLLEALISCGVSMSIAGSSRPCSGSEHLFSHSLDLVDSKESMHGEQCGLGTIIMAYLHKENWKQVKKTLKNIDAPTNSKGLGVENDVLIRAFERAPDIRPKRYTILNKFKPTWHECSKILKSIGAMS